MQAAEKLKVYFQKMHESIELVKQLSEELDRLYKASIHMDFEKSQAANQKVSELTAEISMIHEQRQLIASEFGCTDDRFSLQLAKKLPQKTGLLLENLSHKLIGLMDECNSKLTMHSEQLQLQKQIVTEAVESLNLTVTA